MTVENYFNYFTEIEECFRRCRGTPTLLSTLDWALIESWKEAGVPLEAVLVGVERSFEKFFARPRKGRKVNSLAYCSQEILRAAEEARTAQAESGARPGSGQRARDPFPAEDLLAYLRRNAEALEQASRQERENGQPVLAEDLVVAVATLRSIVAAGITTGANLQEMENQMSALEEKLAASFTRASTVELLARLRREVERGVIPYRQKMSGAQIESLERQFLKRCLFEHYRVPRLSLFYL